MPCSCWLAGRPRDALEACDAILASRPDAAEVLGVRAHALLALKRDRDALRSFDRYLEVGGAPTSDVYRGRGQARMKLGDYAGAADDYTRALLIKPDGDIQTHRGWAYFFAEAPGLALRDFEEAVRLDPENVDARVGRGLARVALGQTGAAVADAEEALRAPRRRPRCSHNIACIFAQAAGRGDPSSRHRRKLSTTRRRRDPPGPRPPPRRRSPGVLARQRPPRPLPRSHPHGARIPRPRARGRRAPPD